MILHIFYLDINDYNNMCVELCCIDEQNMTAKVWTECFYLQIETVYTKEKQS